MACRDIVVYSMLCVPTSYIASPVGSSGRLAGPHGVPRAMVVLYPINYCREAGLKYGKLAHYSEKLDHILLHTLFSQRNVQKGKGFSAGLCKAGVCVSFFPNPRKP